MRTFHTLNKQSSYAPYVILTTLPSLLAASCAWDHAARSAMHSLWRNSRICWKVNKQRHCTPGFFTNALELLHYVTLLTLHLVLRLIQLDSSIRGSGCFFLPLINFSNIIFKLRVQLELASEFQVLRRMTTPHFLMSRTRTTRYWLVYATRFAFEQMIHVSLSDIFTA